MASFTYQRPVLFQHCDPAGIVFYPRYFEMLNEVVEAWFEALGASFAHMHGELGTGVPTARIEAAFPAPSRLGDPLRFALHLLRVGRTSADLRFEATCRGEVRVRAASTLVHVRLAGGRPEPWPEGLRARLLAAADAAVA